MTGRQAVPVRRFAHRRVLHLTPGGYLPGIRLLAGATQVRLGPVTAVIGIARGGLRPAHALGELLRAPVYRVAARHNPTDAPYSPATGLLSYDPAPLSTALAGQRLPGRVLLVDDICGTGATFGTVRAALAAHLTPDATMHTAALCRNTGAVAEPDMWLWTVDDWVHFWWETALPPGTRTADLPVPEQVQPS
jgi:hypoxanthine phosphoribosyltransferase